MKKRLVHITEETVFDQVLQNDKVMKIFKKLEKKWDEKDFSTKTYFVKKASKHQGRGTIYFIIATKPK
jgi:hypothetical protein